MLFQRTDFSEVIASLTAGELLPGTITGYHHVTARAASLGAFPTALHPALLEALQSHGISHPYTHQARAITCALAGDHVVLATPTASGKTLCFNAPVLHTILNAPETRALYLFPTKALAQDQYHGLQRLLGPLNAAGRSIKTFTFDGDTPDDARRAVRDHGHIVITNPDMLHSGILPQHQKWLKLFENLRFIVIDELHTYRGIFGSHVAHVLQRLLRIARFHGSAPQIIACSATIGNPVALAEGLTGQRFTLVDESGGPTGVHDIVTYNPPVVNEELQIRAGVVRGAVSAARALVQAGVSVIVFAGSRLNVELILKYLREEMTRLALDPEWIQGYRGGYLPLLRRKVEAGLRDGRVRCVVSTNALEMGIDIGSLDAAVIAGYPGSIASFRQQSGRAGRRESRSLTLFVAGSRALDQYLVTHPARLLDRVAESARINPRNLYVLMDHAKCAAYELPFIAGEAYAGLSLDETEEVLDHLTRHQVLTRGRDRWHWSERSFPANQVSLRGIPEENFVVIDLVDHKVLAEVDFRSAHTTLHEHAIYHVDSKHYQVERLDYDDHKAFVREVQPDYYTTAMTTTKVSVIQEDARRPWRPHRRPDGAQVPLAVASGEVLVTRKYVGFKKIRFHTNENVGYGEIHLPDLEMHTTATWVDVPRAFIESLPFDRDTVIDGLEVVAHALRTVGCAHLMCAERDLDRAIGEAAGDGSPQDLPSTPTTSGAPSPEPGRAITSAPPQATPEDAPSPEPDRDPTPPHTPQAAPQGAPSPEPDRDPTLFLYDTMPGGVGLAPELFEVFTPLLRSAKSLLMRCGCEHGCPNCSGPLPAYHHSVRTAALALLDAWLVAGAGPGAL